MKKKLFAIIAIALVIATLFGTSLAVSSNPGGSRGKDQEGTIQNYQRGEVVYEYRAAKAGRVAYPLPTATTNSLVMTTIDSEMSITIYPQTYVLVTVTLSIELAVTKSGTRVGVAAYIGKAKMHPNVGGTGYLSGWVARPPYAAVRQYRNLETWTFTWSDYVSRGTKTISFRWAVSNSLYSVWADFYSIEVSAVRVNP